MTAQRGCVGENGEVGHGNPGSSVAAHQDRSDTASRLHKGGLRQRHLTMIALGGIIGASLFVGSGAVIQTVGPAAVLSYALGGLVVIFVMRMLGEMATSKPSLGSFMEYAREALGDRAGFVVGWLYWYFWVGVVAFEAVVGGKLLGGWFNAPDWMFALLLMMLLTATNLLSAKSFGETEFWLASVKVATIIVFLTVGVLFVLGLWPNTSFSVGNIGQGGFVANGGFSVLQGVVIVIFSYFGAEIVTMAAAESKQPAKAVARATNTVVWRILLFYVGSVALLVMITPWREIPSTSSPFAAAFDQFGLPAAEQVVNVVVLTAALSVLNSGLYTSSRMLFALSNRGWAPRWVRDCNTRGVPWKAVLLSTLVGYVAVVMNYVAPDQVFSFIMNSAGAVALFVYIIIALSQLRLRSRMSISERESLGLKMWFHPWLGILVVIGIVVIIFSMGVIESTRPQLLLSLISLAVLVVAYSIVRRIRSKTVPRI
ncbi:amino acid permease [Rhodococcus qingshengii]|uniref:amino acid permease n=1 Tax=Rhodococcus qingshengii TaxID=334542 RepID=UPI0035D6D2D2